MSGSDTGRSARSAGATFAGLLVVYAVAVLVWILAAPRTEVASVGEGRGIVLPGAPDAEPTQLLMFVLLSGGAAVAGALWLWRRHPVFRKASGVLVCSLNLGAMTALASAAATPIADLLVAPSPDLPEGEIARVAPSLGPLFHGSVIPGLADPQWGQLPGFAGWFVLGTTVGIMTFVFLVILASPDPEPDTDKPAAETATG